MKDKVDFKKKLPHLYNASPREVAIVDVREMNFLMVDGQGDPNTAPEFQEAVQMLYGASFTAKFMLKKMQKKVDFTVPPLEGLWWTGKGTQFNMEDKNRWQWTVMIMQPDFVTRDLIKSAIQQVAEKRGSLPISKLRFESFHEGLSAQIMHVGPYCDELPTIERLHAFIRSQGYQPRGKHHEIYLSDPRRCAPEKIRTILREPIV